MGFQSVIFLLGGEEYGLPIEVVQEITQLTEVHPVPQSTKYVKGLIIIRGQAIPLIDLHAKFEIPSRNEAGFAIIMKINDNVVGIAVDEIIEVRTLENVVQAPPLVAASFIGGIVNLPDRLIVQLDPAFIFRTDELEDLKALA